MVCRPLVWREHNIPNLLVESNLTGRQRASVRLLNLFIIGRVSIDMQLSRTLIAAALLLGTSSVMAASSVDLRVVGKITPSACTPALSNGGVVDHGKISAQDLAAWGPTVLPEASMELSITCDAPTLIAVKSTDNRAGTAADSSGSPSMFGLGLASGDQRIGWYTLAMNEISADDVPGMPIESVEGNVWFDAFGAVWQPGFMRTVKDSSSPTPTPLALTTLKAVLDVATTLTKKENLPIAEEIQMDGSATLDVIYL